jgi:NADH-quinone oxidoreductase subunit E
MQDHNINHKIYIKEHKSVEFSPELLNKIDTLIKRYPEGKQKSAILPILHIAQEEFGGWLSPDVMEYIAGLLKIQSIEVYEVATFYSQFYLEKQGKYVLEVCQTGSCAVNGGEDIIEHLEQKLGIKPGETTADGLFSLKAVECLGGCGYAPVMQVNTEFHEHLTIEQIDRLIDELVQNRNSEKSKSSKWEGKFF